MAKSKETSRQVVPGRIHKLVVDGVTEAEQAALHPSRERYDVVAEIMQANGFSNATVLNLFGPPPEPNPGTGVRMIVR